MTEVKRKRMMGRGWGPTCWEEVTVLFRVSSSDLLDMSSACRAWSCSNWVFSYSCTYMRIGKCKTSILRLHQAEGVCVRVCAHACGLCPTCWLVASWAAFNLSCISFFTFSTSSWAARATVIWRVTSAFCETHGHVQFSTDPRLLADPVLDMAQGHCTHCEVSQWWDQSVLLNGSECDQRNTVPSFICARNGVESAGKKVWWRS